VFKKKIAKKTVKKLASSKLTRAHLCSHLSSSELWSFVHNGEPPDLRTQRGVAAMQAECVLCCAFACVTRVVTWRRRVAGELHDSDASGHHGQAEADP